MAASKMMSRCSCRAIQETRRYASTSTSAAASSEASTSKTPYSFSSMAQILPRSPSAPLSPSKSTSKALSSHTLMQKINSNLLTSASLSDATLLTRLSLFSRSHSLPSATAKPVKSYRRTPVAKPGSVMTVTYFINSTRSTTNTFSGVLIGVRRRGVDLTFRLRNMVAKTGVEMLFNATSNMIQDIKIVARADGKKGKPLASGQLLRMRRAKLFYLRDPRHVNRLPNVSNYVRQASEADSSSAQTAKKAASAQPSAATRLSKRVEKQKKREQRKAKLAPVGAVRS